MKFPPKPLEILFSFRQSKKSTNQLKFDELISYRGDFRGFIFIGIWIIWNSICV